MPGASGSDECCYSSRKKARARKGSLPPRRVVPGDFQPFQFLLQLRKLTIKCESRLAYCSRGLRRAECHIDESERLLPVP
jgi:hypothetical protein